MMKQIRKFALIALSSATFCAATPAQEIPPQLQPPKRKTPTRSPRQRRSNLHLQKRNQQIHLDTKSPRRRALRQRRKAGRQTFRRPQLAIHRWQQSDGKSSSQRRVARRELSPLAASKGSNPRRQRRPRKRHHNPTPKHERRQSPDHRLRRSKRRKRNPSPLHRHLQFLRTHSGSGVYDRPRCGIGFWFALAFDLSGVLVCFAFTHDAANATPNANPGAS